MEGGEFVMSISEIVTAGLLFGLRSLEKNFRIPSGVVSRRRGKNWCSLKSFRFFSSSTPNNFYLSNGSETYINICKTFSSLSRWCWKIEYVE